MNYKTPSTRSLLFSVMSGARWGEGSRASTLPGRRGRPVCFNRPPVKSDRDRQLPFTSHPRVFLYWVGGVALLPGGSEGSREPITALSHRRGTSVCRKPAGREHGPGLGDLAEAGRGARQGKGRRTGECMRPLRRKSVCVEGGLQGHSDWKSEGENRACGPSPLGADMGGESTYAP